MRHKYVLAIDQGTTSTKAFLFDAEGQVVGVGQKEHQQVLPRAGWVEHDPREVLDNVDRAIRAAMRRRRVRPGDLAAVGITNQRESTVVWDRRTGKPIHNAIVWQDTRTQALCDELADGDPHRFADITGLPVATYFSGPKIAWLLARVKGARARAARGDLLFGTMDTWLLWNLTGGTRGGLHLTDVTNASRTLLMDLDTLAWSEAMCAAVGVPPAMLPEIRSSSEVYATAGRRTSLAGAPLAGILGDQQAALVGQACFEPGSAKNTYGTGCFLLANTGEQPVRSANGLITTVGYRWGSEPARYALEGSIAVAGSLVQWLRDNLEFFKESSEIEKLAASVPDNGGAYIVPAFSGLFAPYWRPDARGVITGLTRFVTKAHLARAALESTAFQTRDVLEAMNGDLAAAGLGQPLAELRVDGGMVRDELLMQFQADILGVPVVRPRVTETTALGAAYAAGLAVGFWSSTDELRANWREERRFEPSMDAAERAERLRRWRRAVDASLGWEA